MEDCPVPMEGAGIAVETLSSPGLACYSERRIVFRDVVVILLMLSIPFVLVGGVKYTWVEIFSERDNVRHAQCV